MTVEAARATLMEVAAGHMHPTFRVSAGMSNADINGSIPRAIAAAREVVQSGSLFDLGHLPNDVIKEVAGRAAVFDGHGHLPHPFPNYALFHTWEGGSCLYLVVKGENRGSLTAWEWRKWMFDPRVDLLYTYAEMESIDLTTGRYGGRVCSLAAHPDSSPSGELASVLDPILTGRMMIATKGVEVRREHAPAALNASRVKSGKPPLPSFWRVNSAQYTTAIRETHEMDRGPRPHASPRPHLRRGHLRNLGKGRVVPVRDCVVGVADGNEFARKFYTL
jgi:hypothetical protein